MRLGETLSVNIPSEAWEPSGAMMLLGRSSQRENYESTNSVVDSKGALEKRYLKIWCNT